MRSGEWRRFLGEYQEKLRLEAAPKNGKPTAPPVDAETEAKAHMLRNLLECMADPTASEKSKALRRAAYEARFGPVPAEVLQSEAPAN